MGKYVELYVKETGDTISVPEGADYDKEVADFLRTKQTGQKVPLSMPEEIAEAQRHMEAYRGTPEGRHEKALSEYEALGDRFKKMVTPPVEYLPKTEPGLEAPMIDPTEIPGAMLSGGISSPLTKAVSPVLKAARVPAGKASAMAIDEFAQKVPGLLTKELPDLAKRTLKALPGRFAQETTAEFAGGYAFDKLGGGLEGLSAALAASGGISSLKAKKALIKFHLGDTLDANDQEVLNELKRSGVKGIPPNVLNPKARKLWNATQMLTGGQIVSQYKQDQLYDLLDDMFLDTWRKIPLAPSRPIGARKSLREGGEMALELVKPGSKKWLGGTAGKALSNDINKAYQDWEDAFTESPLLKGQVEPLLERNVPIPSTRGLLDKWLTDPEIPEDAKKFARDFTAEKFSVKELNKAQSDIWDAVYKEHPYLGGEFLEALKKDMRHFDDISGFSKIEGMGPVELAYLHAKELAQQKHLVTNLQSRGYFTWAKDMKPHLVIDAMLLPGNVKETAVLKKYIPEPDRQLLASLLLQNLLDKSAPMANGEKIFKPQLLRQYVGDYGKQLELWAPEYKDALERFALISEAAGEALSKASRKPKALGALGLTISAVSGAAGATGGPVGTALAVSVPNTFAAMMANSLMNPKSKMHRYLTEGLDVAIPGIIPGKRPNIVSLEGLGGYAQEKLNANDQ